MGAPGQRAVTRCGFSSRWLPNRRFNRSRTGQGRRLLSLLDNLSLQRSHQLAEFLVNFHLIFH
jgi:hypothetical protein